jgi:hypothetical protein
VSSTRTIQLRREAAAARLYDVTISVSDEIGDSSVDCQSYVAFVIDIVETLGLDYGNTEITVTGITVTVHKTDLTHLCAPRIAWLIRHSAISLLQPT